MSRRLLLAAFPLALTLTATAGAQEARLFENSWFWGVHAGGTSIGTPVRGTMSSATIGADWFITRQSGGLYVAYDHTNFAGISAVTDPSAAGGQRLVDIHGMHTVSLGAMAFPFHAGGFRPYAGLGFALDIIGTANARADSTGAAASSSVSQQADEARSHVALFGLGGVQWQTGRLALYGQVQASPGSSDFLVSRQLTTITAGVRYNFGSSIER